jgi:hypothetical protein
MERLPLCVLSITKRLPNQITVNPLLLFIYYYIYQCKRKFANMKKETYQDFASWWRTGHFRNCRYNLNQEGYQIFTAAGKEGLLKLKGIAWFDHNGCDDAWNGRYGSLWKHQKIPELRNVIIAFLTARRRLFASGRIWCWSWWLYHKTYKA